MYSRKELCVNTTTDELPTLPSQHQLCIEDQEQFNFKDSFAWFPLFWKDSFVQFVDSLTPGFFHR